MLIASPKTMAIIIKYFVETVGGAKYKRIRSVEMMS